MQPHLDDTVQNMDSEARLALSCVHSINFHGVRLPQEMKQVRKRLLLRCWAYERRRRSNILCRLKREPCILGTQSCRKSKNFRSRDIARSSWRVDHGVDPSAAIGRNRLASVHNYRNSGATVQMRVPNRKGPAANRNMAATHKLKHLTRLTTSVRVEMEHVARKLTFHECPYHPDGGKAPPSATAVNWTLLL